MATKIIFNPFTGNFDYVNDGGGALSEEALDILFEDCDPESYEPAGENPPGTRNYFFSEKLHSDGQYVASFGGNFIAFFDCRNPYAIEEILNIVINPAPGAFGQPQALTSIGDFVYVCTTNGKIHTIDWSDRENPAVVAEVTISSGQHYDIASNEVDTLFVANVSNNLFIAIDATTPTALTLINTSPLGGFGAGVAYYDGYAYCTNFQASQIHTFEFSGGTWNDIDQTPSATNSARLSVGVNPEGDNFLISNRYNSNSFAVHDLFDPANIGAANIITTPEQINIYSRAFFIDGIMYTNSRSGNVLVYNLRDINDVVAVGVYEPVYPDDTKRFTDALGGLHVQNEGAATGKFDYIFMTGRNAVGGTAASNRSVHVLKLPLLDVIVDNTRQLDVSKTISGVGLYYEIITAGITVTLPVAPIDGDIFNISNFSAGSATISGNGNNILGAATQTIFKDEAFSLIYNDTEWKVI